MFVNFHALLPTFPFFISSGRRCRTIDLATALFSIAPILSWRPFVGWLVDTQGRRLVLICGLAGVAFVPMGYFISAGIATVDTSLKLGELFEPMSVPAAVTQLSFMMVYGVVEVYVAIYAVLHCLPSEGIYFIGIAVATVATRILLGRVVVSPVRRDWCTGNAAIITGILLLVFAHNIPCYLLLAALLGYSFGAVQPALQTMVMPAERRGAASSTFFVAFDFGIALGGFFAGLLVKYRGYDDMFLGMLLVLLLSIVLHYLFGRRHPSSSPPPPKKRIRHEPDNA